MPEERAFTRRQPGVNPIALELDRLAEQQALLSLSTPRRIGGPPPSEPRNARGQTQGEERDARDMQADQAAHSSLLDQMKSIGAEAALAGIPTDALAMHAEMADTVIGDALDSGQAYVNPKDGGLYSVDPDPDRVLGRNLDVFNEFQRRVGGATR